ncbi:DUF4239 domain-containing protein [Microvirga subterranea]|uniref:Uncharacterized protein DUF4239 n=1 Tax=Microvirga subterranea TaxID=186651 RepID=A0A370HKK0_9HYPH|nr:DUF4239 domain-containing protein [Microvirga subterranea]RDI59102.1 uncharacterized protein DUF4239 [Microvirga subterranea]
MGSVLASLFTFIAVFCGAMIGIVLSGRLPAHHMSPETRTAVSVSMAVVGTLSALVIGLMISTASTAFNERTNAIEALAVDIVKLDRALLRIGSDAASIRKELRNYAEAKVEELSSPPKVGDLSISKLANLETISDQVVALQPHDDRGRQIQEQALQLLGAIADARWLLVEKSGVTMPAPFLLLVIFWLTLLFASFGLFAPNNGTVIAILFLCAMAISGGIFMILELGAPTRGLVRASVAPLHYALDTITTAD